MKNIYKLLSIFLLGTLTACSNDILDVSPSDGLPEDVSVTDVKSAKVVLDGVYDALQGSNTETGVGNGVTYYGARMIYYGDVKSDDMQATSPTGRTGLTYTLDFNLNNAPGIWGAPYTVITRANKLLKAIDEGKAAPATDAEKATVNDYKGQALAIRALAHFDLVRIYGEPYIKSNGSSLGVPILTKPVAYDYIAGRNTVAEVYDQVIADLNEAIKLLKSEKNLGYFNSWAAKSLLSRVYLYKGDNQKAYDLAVDVIDNSKYILWTNEEYAGVWSKQGTSEVLFEIINYNTEDWTDRESIGYLYAEKGYGDGIMTKAYLDLVNSKYTGDVRLDLMIRSTLVDSLANKQAWKTNKVYITKYPGREGYDDIRVNNLAILRLSETYLIAAEAAAKLSDTKNAAKYLNAIVKRGNPSAKEVSSADATVDRILQENRVEFVGEGHRFFDLIRNGKSVFRYTDETDRAWHLILSSEARNFNIGYSRALLPIPQKEVNSNSIIKGQQNPGY